MTRLNTNSQRLNSKVLRNPERKITRKRSRRMWSGRGERSEMWERLRRAESTVRESRDGGVLIHSIYMGPNIKTQRTILLSFSLSRSEPISPSLSLSKKGEIKAKNWSKAWFRNCRLWCYNCNSFWSLRLSLYKTRRPSLSSFLLHVWSFHTCQTR